MLRWKANDPQRQRLTEFLDAWARVIGINERVTWDQVPVDLLIILEPTIEPSPSRNKITNRLQRLDGARAGGYVFKVDNAAKHTAATYWVERKDGE